MFGHSVPVRLKVSGICSIFRDQSGWRALPIPPSMPGTNAYFAITVETTVGHFTSHYITDGDRMWVAYRLYWAIADPFILGDPYRAAEDEIASIKKCISDWAIENGF